MRVEPQSTDDGGDSGVPGEGTGGVGSVQRFALFERAKRFAWAFPTAPITPATTVTSIVPTKTPSMNPMRPCDSMVNMPTTITLDGARRPGRWNIFTSRLRGVQPWGPAPGSDDRGQWLGRPVGDVWSDDAAGGRGNAIADFTTSVLGWGILAFAAGTMAYRGYGAVKKLL